MRENARKTQSMCREWAELGERAVYQREEGSEGETDCNGWKTDR